MNNIEILEEFIKNFKEVQEKYKDDEIQAEIERSCYFEEVPAQAIENLIQENKELKVEKVLNEKILYLANNTICNYHEGYQAGLHKELTATEIVAREREKFIISQEIKRLKDTIYELHNQLYEGNKRVKEDYIPKSKVKAKIEELEKLYKLNLNDSLTTHEMFYLVHDYILKLKNILQELLEGEENVRSNNTK